MPEEDKKKEEEKPQRYEMASHPLPMNKIISNNFIGGVAWALGATIGLGIIFAVLGIVAKSINFVPIVGSFASEVINFVLNNNPNLHR